MRRLKKKGRGYDSGDCKIKRTFLLSPKGSAAMDELADRFRGYTNRSSLNSIALVFLLQHVRLLGIEADERVDEVCDV